LSGSDQDRPPRWPDLERRAAADRRQKDRRKPAARPRHGEDQGRFNPAERRKEDRRSGKDRRDEDAWQPIPLEPVPPVPVAGESGLVAAAIEARRHAHAQYSGFKVGAALETVEGFAISGCNIENATYGLTLCAERVALVKALSEGYQIFTRIAIAADTDEPTPPCGACRQLLWEYCGDIEIVLANTTGVTGRHRLAELLPRPFDSRLLK
jgi:cytidine deaminase